METTTNTTKPPRYNRVLKWSDFAPPVRQDGLCRCGCGVRARRVWATNKCHKPFLIRFLILKGCTSTIRDELLKRDRGICAGCALDVEKARTMCGVYLWADDFAGPAAYREDCQALEAMREKYRRLGYPAPSVTWWQADHILEVVNGGGGCDLDGYQTLCVVCHAKKTARLAGDLAAARRAAKTQGRQGPHRIQANLP